ncbi:MAG: type II secretion system protein GspD [Betaproteobacteria bacterium]
MTLGNRAAVLSLAGTLLAGLLAGCGQAPIRPSATHVRADQVGTAGAIPPPVQVAPVLPRPKPTARPETYSVVVNNVKAQELLFALARDARLQIDIDPNLSGTVTLNAIDQTLPQILSRIARQIDLRWEIDGENLVVLRDTPYLRSYRIDYLGAGRNVKMTSSSSTQFAAAAAGGVSSTSQTGAVAVVDVSAVNTLWESIVQNVKDILQETDKVLPAGAAAQAPTIAPAPVVVTPPTQPGALPQLVPQVVPPPPPAPSFREAASVIANRETGVLYVRATSKQHERVQEFIDQVLASARRQVLIEATVAEVQLNNEYQRGIDWSRLRGGATGFQFSQSSAGTPANITTGNFVVGLGLGGLNFLSAIRLLESFGDVKVLSSPKLSVLNNQAALLRVTRDIVYFTITPSTSATASTTGTVITQPAFTTTPNIAAEGFMMSVLTQINEADTVVLNVRPTVRRRVGFTADPNPALVPPIQNLIPVFETREFDSILRIQSGQVAVLGGLMQDSVATVEDTVPFIRDIPILGDMLAHRRDENRKTELVIVIKATVIRDASLEGDFAGFRTQVPGDDFLSRPNPTRSARPVGPRESAGGPREGGAR